MTYKFPWIKTEKNKKYAKALRCREVVISPVGGNFYMVTLIEATEKDMGKCLDDNYEIIMAMMDGDE